MSLTAAVPTTAVPIAAVVTGCSVALATALVPKVKMDVLRPMERAVWCDVVVVEWDTALCMGAVKADVVDARRRPLAAAAEEAKTLMVGEICIFLSIESDEWIGAVVCCDNNED